MRRVFFAGTDNLQTRFCCMSERVVSLHALLEESFGIAWNYLQATGELGDAATANRFLGDTIELMIRAGHRNRLVLSNKAIFAYQRFKLDRGIHPANWRSTNDRGRG
jgi:hypothetical protein